ncbi:hypothetical protein Tco_1070285, partial [Tanacetum coccineum]
ATEKDEIIHSLAWQRIAFAAIAGKHGTIATLNALNAKTGPTHVFLGRSIMSWLPINLKATEKDEIIHSLAWQRIAFAAMAGKHGTIAALNALNAKNDPTRIFALTVISHGAVGTPSDFGKKRGNKFNGFRVKRMTISGGSRFQAGVWNGLFSGLMDFLISEKLPSSCSGLAYEVIRFEILKANLKKAQVAWERVAKEQQKVVEERRVRVNVVAQGFRYLQDAAVCLKQLGYGLLKLITVFPELQEVIINIHEKKKDPKV